MSCQPLTIIVGVVTFSGCPIQPCRSGPFGSFKPFRSGGIWSIEAMVSAWMASHTNVAGLSSRSASHFQSNLPCTIDITSGSHLGRLIEKTISGPTNPTPPAPPGATRSWSMSLPGTIGKIACSASGSRSASGSWLIAEYEMPVMPVLPWDHGCALVQPTPRPCPAARDP